MALTLRTLPVLINPATDKSGDKKEVIIPSNFELRNGDITQNKNWGKRPGYVETYLTGTTHPVARFIDFGVGFAILTNGDIYRLDTLAKLTVKLQGKIAGETYNPEVVHFDEIITIWDGGNPIKIVDNNSEYLGGNPPSAKYAARIGAYIFVAYGNIIEWCSANNPEGWSGVGDSDFITVREDGYEQNGLKAIGSYLFSFKSHSVEVWVLIGGEALIARNDSMGFNVGLLAEASLVVSQNSLLWFGHTKDFYEVTLGSNDPRILSTRYKMVIDNLNFPEDLRGLVFDREYKIRWLSHKDEVCVTYDYFNKVWQEDNTWDGNDWRRLPFNCVMYMDNNAYVGSSLPDGKVHRWGKDVSSDNGTPIRVYRGFVVSPFNDGMSSEGTLIKANVRLKRGVGNTSATAPQLVFRCRVHEGKWLTYHIPLGEDWDKKTDYEFFINLFGSEFEIELVETDLAEFLITDMWLTMLGNEINA